MSASNSGSICKNRTFIIIGSIMVISIIMMPFTYGISFASFLLAVLICIISQFTTNQIRKRQSILSEALIVAESYESEPNESNDSVSFGDSHYIFPKKCPSCHTDLHLDRVKWVDSESAICPYCELVVRAGD